MAPLDGSGSVKEEDEDKDNASNPNPSTNGEVSVGGGISIRSATGKKRGTIFKCESCSKVSLSAMQCNLQQGAKRCFFAPPSSFRWYLATNDHTR